jgi:hypothetical protein
MIVWLQITIASTVCTYAKHSYFTQDSGSYICQRQTSIFVLPNGDFDISVVLAGKTGIIERFVSSFEMFKL